MAWLSYFGLNCCCMEGGGVTVETTVSAVMEEGGDDAPAPALVKAASLELGPISPKTDVNEDDIKKPGHELKQQAGVNLSTSVADETAWDIFLVKTATLDSLGLDLMIDRKQQLSVLSHPTKRGLVLSWNTDHPDQAVIAGDIVESVNGFRGPAKELLGQIKEALTLAGREAQAELNLRMRRLIRCEVIVPCVDNNLGLELREFDGALVIDKVLDDGDVRKANTRCLAGFQVAVGHMIVKVNGKSGDAEQLVQLLRDASGDVTLSLYRPPGASLIY